MTEQSITTNNPTEPLSFGRIFCVLKDKTMFLIKITQNLAKRKHSLDQYIITSSNLSGEVTHYQSEEDKKSILGLFHPVLPKSPFKKTQKNTTIPLLTHIHNTHTQTHHILPACALLPYCADPTHIVSLYMDMPQHPPHYHNPHHLTWSLPIFYRMTQKDPAFVSLYAKTQHGLYSLTQDHTQSTLTLRHLSPQSTAPTLSRSLQTPEFQTLIMALRLTIAHHLTGHRLFHPNAKFLKRAFDHMIEPDILAQTDKTHLYGLRMNLRAPHYRQNLPDPKHPHISQHRILKNSDYLDLNTLLGSFDTTIEDDYHKDTTIPHTPHTAFLFFKITSDTPYDVFQHVYRESIKRHHPDLNPGINPNEIHNVITQGKILKEYYQKNTSSYSRCD